MADSPEKDKFETIIRLLLQHGVEFIVIGGQAETLHGSPRATYDTDLCYRRTPENLHRLAEALKPLKPTLRNAPPNLPFKADVPTLAAGSNFTFLTTAGSLDLLGYVEPLGDFDRLTQRQEVYPFEEGMALNVIALDDLITIKKHLSRMKDRESLMQLLAIKRIRGEGK